MSFQERLSQIRDRIDRAAKGRVGGRDVRLLAVSKFHPASAVAEALQAGLSSFGENRVQEAKGKFPAFQAAHPALELSLIGALQTNKAEEAVSLFDAIETLDREKLAAALAAAVRKRERHPRFLIEVNLGREPQKAGIAPENLEAFLETCRDRYGLSVSGLMAIPPFGVDPVPFFRELVSLADRFNLPERSIGMSDDFEQAIACGSTEVRIGTALFGKRTVS